MAEPHETYKETHALHSAINSLQLQDLPVGSRPLLLCDISNGLVHPIILTSIWQLIFDMLHSVSHPGIHTSHKLRESHFVWVSFHRDILTVLKLVFLVNSQNSIITQPAHFRISWCQLLVFTCIQYIHVEIVGPLLPSKRHSYLFTTVDCFNWWPKVVRLIDMTA